MKRPKKRQSKKLYTLIGAVLAILFIVILLLILSQTKRQPNTSAFCNQYLGTSWNSADLSKRIIKIKELEKVAPDEIYNEVHAIREAWERMDKDPAGALAIDLSVSASRDKLNDFGRRCQKEKERATFCNYYKKHPRPVDDTNTTVKWLEELRKNSMPADQAEEVSRIVLGYNQQQHPLGWFGEYDSPGEAEAAIPGLISDLNAYCSKT